MDCTNVNSFGNHRDDFDTAKGASQLKFLVRRAAVHYAFIMFIMPTIAGYGV